MWHRIVVVLTDVSEERIASIFSVEGKIRKSASEETVRTGAPASTRCNIPEDCFLHSHRRENLKSYKLAVVQDQFSNDCCRTLSVMNGNKW
jgi:CRISPR/Cas system CMR subunit Cmr4 (Cas7 group RAMP superfamily)